ncbi:V-type ATP synthase subunit B [Candidatus Poribacteria bacterium]|nr:V-type ATP synthase subunit B [Candidatus Poribacteria bacterium]
MQGKEYIGLSHVSGPIIVVEGITGVGFDEMVEVTDPTGEVRIGRVLEISEDLAVIQVFGGTRGLAISSTRVRFVGRPLELEVSRDMIGRVFNGLGEPIDGIPKPFATQRMNINGVPINPTSREYPRDFIQTGISTIDCLNTLVRGQKLPIFSGSGMPHNLLARQIVRQAKLVGGEENEEFVVVFAAMGIKHDDAEFFRRGFEETGALNNVVMFLNLADDPSIERLITPRCALTVAEYLAFYEGIHVLVILTDMTNYAEALREIASAREEVPSRKGYPGYMYSDLASLYERTGRIQGATGSVTQLPILSMPNDDINHPIPDLTGYITEGQIVLSREINSKGIYPPVNVPRSLSRLMKDGIGENKTRPDHPNLQSQLYAAYANVQSVRSLASVIGEEELSEIDRNYLQFGEHFEQEFIGQKPDEDRSIEETLDIGWQVLSYLPETELHRVSEDEIAQFYVSASS